MGAEVNQRESVRWTQFTDVLVNGWVFRWPTLVVYAVIGLPFAANSEFARLTNPSIVTAVGVSAISVGLTVVLLSVVGATRRVFPPGPAWLVVVGLSGIGATRGWLATQIIDGLGVNENSYLDSRVMLSAAAVPVLVIASASIVSTIARGRRERAITKKATADLRVERDEILAEITRKDEILLAESEGTLRPQIDAIRELALSRSSDARESISAALDNLITTVVRPLSHSLAASARTHHASTESIRIPTETPVFPTADSFIGPLVTAAAVYLTTVVIFFDIIPLAEGLMLALVGAGITWIILRGFQALMAGLTLTIGFILGVVFLAHLGTALLVAWVDVSLFRNNKIGLEITIALSAASLVPGLLYVAQRLMAHLGALRLSELATARREMSIEASEVRRRAWLRQRHIAHALHSAIQSRVNAESRLVRLGNGPLTSEDRTRINQTLDEILHVLRNTDEAPTDSLGELRRAIEFWHGMCEVDVEVDEAAADVLRREPEIGEAVLVLCLEIINNAIRHGKSNRMRLSVARISIDMLKITGSNNGEPLGEYSTGLGMSMFDELTVHWSAISDEAETTVTAYIAAR